MAPEARGHELVSGIRRAVDRHVVTMAVIGLLAGYSLSMLGTDAVAVPGVGPVPGTLVGVTGLAVAGVAYLRFGCCGDCGSRTLGLTGSCDCGDDSCS